MHKTILFDQLTPVALYGQIKNIFPNDITMLFESVVNTSDGNFSFITIGAQERLSYKNKTTIIGRKLNTLPTPANTPSIIRL